MDFLTLKKLISASNKIVGFTGAGISTESGIPDFRSPNGVWANNRTIEFQEFIASRAGRIEAWRQKAIAWPEMRAAQPNNGHKAFVELEQRSQLRGMITQNIDGLHQRAGHHPTNVIELHGTTAFAECLQCGDRITMDEALQHIELGDLAPECEKCFGLLKPATVSFGQAMPEIAMQRAAALCDECEIFIVAGSSLVVYPAASFPARAKQQGAKLIIINRDATPLDEMADLVMHDEIGVALPQLIAP